MPFVNTTPPPHDGKLHSKLSEEFEDGATIGPRGGLATILVHPASTGARLLACGIVCVLHLPVFCLWVQVPVYLKVQYMYTCTSIPVLEFPIKMHVR